MIANIVNKIRKNKFTVMITVFVIGLMSITIGSALLNTLLTITGNTKIKENRWLIHFDNVQIDDDSVKNSDPRKDARIIDNEKTKIEFTVNLTNPGDLYEFTVDTWNEGTLDAVIASTEMTELTEEQKKYIEFDVRYYDTGEEVKRCDELKVQQKRPIIVTVKLKDGLNKNDYPQTDVTLNLFYKINYVQSFECPTTPSQKHILKIRPNGGKYNKRTTETRIYLNEGDEYDLKEATRLLYNFDGWEVTSPTENGTYTLSDNHFTMGKEDVVVQAKWLEGNYVARIMNTYYTSVQDAFDAVGSKNWEDNTVWLLKDLTESPTNNTNATTGTLVQKKDYNGNLIYNSDGTPKMVNKKEFIFNLDGHTLNGTITNSKVGAMSVVNGKVIALPEGNEAVVNYGKFTMGIEGEPVLAENSISLQGNDIGIRNVKSGDNVGEFYLYDGYIEGAVALVGGYTDKETDYHMFSEHVSSKNCQRVYLIRDPNRAVAKTTTDGTMYYYNLQDAINTVTENKKIISGLTDNDYVIYALREFEAAYELTIPENSRVFFDMKGYTISTGEKITNNGYFKIFNSSDVTSRILSSVALTNNGTLDLDNVIIHCTTDDNAVNNKGTLKLKTAYIEGTNGYGVNNTDNGTITMDLVSTIQSTNSYGLHNTSNNFVLSNGNVYGFNNEANSTINGTAKVHKGDSPYAIKNTSTLNINGGEVSDTSSEILINNTNGTIVVNNGTISSTNTAINDGIVTVNGGTITSNNGPTINTLNVTVTGGTVNSENGIAINSLTNQTNKKGTVNVTGGTVSGATTAIKANEVNVSNGIINSNDIGIETVKYTSGSNVVNDKANITGGTITGTNAGIKSNNIEMSNGTVTSTEGNGIEVKENGTITGGTVSGDLYGIKNEGKLTLGIDDETISSESPVIIGNSYGVNSTGTEFNVYDGILKGQVDGYLGEITGTSSGSMMSESTETIDGKEYYTDYSSQFSNWLRIGDKEYNTLDAATSDITDSGTIEVTRNTKLTFTQTTIDMLNNKNIILDLKGFSIESSQPIENNSILKIVDSSNEKTGQIKFTRSIGIKNNDNSKLTIDGGTYQSTNSSIIENRGQLIIDNANMSSTSSIITNYNDLTINNINVTSSDIAIINTGEYLNNNTSRYKYRGLITINGGTINSTTKAISLENKCDKAIINNGTIKSNGSGISGEYGSVVINNGTVSSKSGNAIYTKNGSVEVNNGTVSSLNNVGILSGDITINGGTVSGTTGIKNDNYCAQNSGCHIGDITVNGGHVIGTEREGINATNNNTYGNVYIYGGTIEGQTDGVYTTAKIQIGNNEGTIDVDKPELIGHTTYGLRTNAYTAFYDGTLKGLVDGYNGLISIIPDGTLITNDYEYINKIEYQTDSLSTKGHWLEVNGQPYNSLTTAYDAIEGNSGTIVVVADSYVDFEQELPNDKKVTIDLNGHSIIMTQPLIVNGEVIIKDSKVNGSINNIRDTAIINRGTLSIQGGIYQSEVSTTINNSGTLNISSGTIKQTSTSKSDTYTIYNTGNLTISGGTITSDNNIVLETRGTTTINDGTITGGANYGIRISANKTTINGGTITSNTTSAIYNNGGSNNSLEINNGEIIGGTTGITNNSTSNNIKITGGSIKGNNGDGLSTNCITNITGGTIEGSRYGVYQTGSTLTLGNNDNVLNIDVPVLKGELYGLYVNSGTTKFYDGILKGITGRYSGIIDEIPSNAQIYDDEEILDSKNYKTNYLVMETEVVRNVEQNKKYSNLQLAINEAKEGQTLELLTNVPLFYELVNDNEESFILDLKGKTISTNKKITNNGNITIKNSSDELGTLKTSATINLILNNNTLVLDNISIKNNSSNNYVISNTGNLSVNKINIDSINGIQNSSTLVVDDSIIKATKATINNSGTLTINKGTYTSGTNGDSYSLYSNSNNQVTISNATFNGVYYNAGNNTSTMTKCNLNSSLQNVTSKLTINESNIINGRITNNGTLTINDSQYKIRSTDTCITNNNLMTINNTNINVNTEGNNGSATAILNTKNLNINEGTTINVGFEGSTYDYKGIINTGDANTLINNGYVNVVGGNNTYGVYVDSNNAKVTILSGKISAEKSSISYGVYINKGTFEMGHYEGTGTENADVSIKNPIVFSQGNSRGIGVKRISGSLNFYDGIIWGSRYAKPETTANVEYKYEATTYIDADKGYEYSILEFMPNNHQEEAVAVVNGVYCTTVQEAIDKATPAHQVRLLKSVSENISVLNNKEVTINLNQHSISGTVTNYGTLAVYNGSLQSFDKTTVLNNGTFIMGEDDGKVSSSNVRIVSETTTIKNNGTLVVYDGYIEGATAVDGTIDRVANLSRIRTEKDIQSEKKYLQSLSQEAIESGQTDLIITINPANGVYDGSKKVREIYIKHGQSYQLKEIKRSGCDFLGWEISDPDVLVDDTITMNISDVVVTAKWEISPDAVAKIGEDYYTSLQDAFDNAVDGDVIELFKDTTEPTPTNRKKVTLNLGGKTFTGGLINIGELKILNGTIKNTDGVGIVNRKTLTLGENDGNIEENAIKIIGTTIGLQQDGRFNFYDGFIEGDIALSGRVDSQPKGYFLYNDHDYENDCQKVYLIGKPDNAVAETRVGGTQYFFSLQDAIDTSTITGYKIFIRRDFEATYALNIKENANIDIDTCGKDITVSNDFVVNGTLNLHNDVSELKRTEMTTARVIQVETTGTLTMDSVDININNTSAHVFNNKGSLTISNSKVTAQNGNAVYTSGVLSLGENSELISNTYSIYNNQTEPLELNHGKLTGGINNPKQLVLDGDVEITVTREDGEYYGINMKYSDAKLTMRNGKITSWNTTVYVYGYRNEVNISGGELESTYRYVVYTYGYSNSNKYWDNYENKINISGGKFINGSNHNSYYHDIYVTYSSYINVTGGTFINNSNYSTGTYAITCGYYSKCNIENAKIYSNTSSGISIDNSVFNMNIDNVDIELYGYDSRGINLYSSRVDGTISNTKIFVPKKSTYGIYSNPSLSKEIEVVLNNVDIKSGNQGLYIQNTSSYNYIFTIKSGTIKGDTYGIYQYGDKTIINVGDKTRNYLKDEVFIRGGLYGIYKYGNGITNFYNGKIGGVTDAYSTALNDIRTKMNITEEEEDNDEIIETISHSTTDVSEDATSNIPKKGNGYARITYIGETNDTCTNGDLTNIDYSGEEYTYTVPCTGKYKIEVWGASGGSFRVSNKDYDGGYGGYAAGNVTLNKDDTLYVNIGGAGSFLNGRNIDVSGGYNGGGSAHNQGNSYNLYIASGGGATHIATKSGLLSALVNDKDKILIVAGGGGGSIYYTNSNGYYGFGGSGGGYNGGPALYSDKKSKQTQYGGTQFYAGYYTTGTSVANGSFGQGGSMYTCSTNSNCYGSGAGGGYFGGASYPGYGYGAGGGSGYVNLSQVSSSIMYSYDAYPPVRAYIIKYLIPKDMFLQVGEEQFNNLDEAIAAASQTNGVIKVIKDAEISEESTILAEMNITLDLNNFTLTTTQPITNKGMLTIVDNSDGKNGKIDNQSTNTIINKGDLIIDGIKLNSAKQSSIYADSGNGTITLKNNPTVTGVNCIHIKSAQTLNMLNGTVTGTTSGIKLETQGATINIKDGLVSTTGTSNNYGIYDVSPNNSSNLNNIVIDGGEVSGRYYGVYLQGSHLTINNGAIKNIYPSSANAYYVVYMTSAIAKLTINGGQLSGDYTSGIYASGTIVMNGGQVLGSGGYGITISTTNNTNVTINSGSVIGKQYGINQTSSSSNTIVGDKTKQDSDEDPLIQGEDYGIYNTAGKVSFYNGQLKGKLYGYYKELDVVAKGKKVDELYEKDEGVDDRINKNTTHVSQSPESESLKVGNGFVRIKYIGSSNNTGNYNSNSNYEEVNEVKCTLNRGQSLNYDYTGTRENYTIECPGKYKLEVWGAQGGESASYSGGKGGYSIGTTTLNKNDKIYISVGGKGNSGTSGTIAGGYNGGGKIVIPNNCSKQVGTGGGATDIRINGDSLYNRVIVAGGGGGSLLTAGTYGGGTTSAASTKNGNGAATAATQTSGGYFQGSSSSQNYSNGSFGQGGYLNNSSNCSYYGASGGGGWYGGGYAGPSAGGSGGSGWIYTSSTFNTWKNGVGQSTANNYKLFYNYYLSDANTYAGNVEFTSPTGETITGKEDNGYARITYLGSGDPNKAIITLNALEGKVTRKTFEYNIGDELGDIPSPTTDESLTFEGWFLDNEFTKKVTSSSIVKDSAVLYAKYSYNESYCNADKVYDYNYTGSEQSFISKCAGQYKLEVWGAQGGDTEKSGAGGYGGYSTGTIELDRDETLYINVGGKGTSSNYETLNAQGGYNGGGNAYTNYNSTSTFYYNASGGGATSIAFTSGLLSELSDKKEQIVIVAGGGGGAISYIDNNYSYNGSGGSGGGEKGTNGTGNNTSYCGTGGTQTTGGTNTGSNAEYFRGSFGKGGGTSTSNNIYSGGGGGYYGGGATYSYYCGAGGGSGYVNNDLITDPKMYNYGSSKIKNGWVTNFLSLRDGFLSVDGTSYSSFEEAIESISGSGTIKVLEDKLVQEQIVIPLGKNITIDMNGKKITLSQTIINNSNLIITDNSDNKKGYIYNTTTDLIENNGNVTIKDIKAFTPKNAVNGKTGTGSITVEGNTDIKCLNAITLSSEQSVNLNSGKIEAEYRGIVVSKDNTSINVHGGTIKCMDNAVTVNAKSLQFTMTAGSLESQSGYGIYDSNSKAETTKSHYSIKGGNISGSMHGIYLIYADAEIENATIEKVTGNNSGYALNCNSYTNCTISNNSTIKATGGSGIYLANTYTNQVVNISDTTFDIDGAYGIYLQQNTLNLTNVNINAKGSTSYGLYYYSSYNINVNMNNTNINSENIGVYINYSSTSYTQKLYINSGSVKGKTYAIYETGPKAYVYIGNIENENNTENPYIEGGLYSIYKTQGYLYYYSGMLKGYIKGNPDTIDTIRDDYEIYESTSDVQEYIRKNRTYNTEEASETAISEIAKIGNGYAKIKYVSTVLQSNDEVDETTNNNDICNELEGKTYDFTSIRDVQEFTTKCSGKYKLEVWGAQGGYLSQYTTTTNGQPMGGRGGYASGYVNLDSNEKLLVYVGSSGNNGGYNGGGQSIDSVRGGGATDIRLNSSLYSRIIVAGGGGSGYNTGNYPGGAGGGTNGVSSYSGGGTQTGGYSFGQGCWSYSMNYNSAGGGGWYGGNCSSYSYGGGGGSGFVYKTGVNVPKSYQVSAKYLLSDTQLIDGNNMMPSYKDDRKMTGNYGDGYARITFVKASEENDSLTVKLSTPIGTLNDNELHYYNGSKLGNINSPLLEDNNLVFEGWYSDSDYINKVTSDYIINRNQTLYAKIRFTNEACENKINTEIVFDYTGSEQTFTPKCAGTYKLEVWGAQGGNPTYDSKTYTGGYGGYSTGYINLNSNEKLYINVGGQGASISATYGTVSHTVSSVKGYNGGTNATYYNQGGSGNVAYLSLSSGGGGATHIATKSGILRTLSKNKESVLIVAGGGGGASINTVSDRDDIQGGSGGGYKGGDLGGSITECHYYGVGGTQSSAGRYKVCAAGSNPSISHSYSYATFGQGSGNLSTGGATQTYLTGGGGGWYGGGAGYNGPGGGGSGYTGNSRLSDTAMYSYGAETTYDGDRSKIAYLIRLKESIKNETQNKTYKNLQDAIDEVDEDDVLILTDNTNISYNVEIPESVKITLDLNGYELSANKTITNYGKITLTNNKNNTTSKLNNHVDAMFTNHGSLYISNVIFDVYKAIDNKASARLDLTNVTINATNQGLINNGRMTIIDSYISGDVYGIYSNTANDNTITNSTLVSKETAFYKYSTSKTTITNTNIRGNITNYRTNAILNITGGTINGIINNSGSTTFDNVTMTYTSSKNSSETMISNSSILNINECHISNIYTGYMNDNNITMKLIYNSGTLISNNNEYLIKYDYNNKKYRTIYGIHNAGLLTSSNDKIDASGSNRTYAVLNASTNESVVTNSNIKVYNGVSSYALYNSSGNIRFSSGTFNSYDSTNGGGVYVAAGHATLANITISSHDNSTNSYGSYLAGGKLTIESGIVNSTGVNAYGSYSTNGTLVLGIVDDSGTDSADVSYTDPHVSAVGSETGIGVVIGDGSLEFYDGYITGSTSPRGTNTQTAKTNKNYQVIFLHDEETGYDYSILEYMK